jgi:hypothetical protein
MTTNYRYTVTEISDRLAQAGLPADVIYAIKESVQTFRLSCTEAIRISEGARSIASGIAHCARRGEVYSTEDLCIASDDLSRLGGIIQISHNNIEHSLTIAQHLIGVKSHDFMMEMSAMIWS